MTYVKKLLQQIFHSMVFRFWLTWSIGYITGILLGREALPYWTILIVCALTGALVIFPLGRAAE